MSDDKFALQGLDDEVRILQFVASGLISRQTAARLVAERWGLDPDEEWGRIEAERTSA